MKYSIKILLLLLISSCLSSCFRDIKVQDTKPPRQIQSEVSDSSSQINSEIINSKRELITENDVNISTWVTGLDVPWSLVFLDDNRALVTQRGGKITQVLGGKLQETPYWRAPSVEFGEGGLLGIEKDPNFIENKLIYVMYMYQDGDIYKEKIVRLIDEGDKAVEDSTIIDNIPAAKYHNGGRIKFGPDGKLYITTGDAREPDIAQDMNSLGGKILRINSDGSIPLDNPFESSPIYTLGHRNPQGITWEPETQTAFISTHGPSGEFLLTARDRVDVLKPGANYGWPIVAGYSEDYEDPLAYWPETATPPSGMTFWNGSLFVATLKSETLLQLEVQKSGDAWELVSENRWLQNKHGRLRDAVVGPDGNLYILTSNADGRGEAETGGDIILKIEKK